MKIAIGYCPSCTQKGLAMLDVATEHAETLKRIQNAIRVQGALGGPLEAMTEICFLLDMPMPAKREPEKYDARWASAALDMLILRFKDLLRRFFMDSDFGEYIMREIQERKKHYESEQNRYHMMRDRVVRYDMGVQPIPQDLTVRREYVVPEYRVKENKR